MCASFATGDAPEAVARPTEDAGAECDGGNHPHDLQAEEVEATVLAGTHRVAPASMGPGVSTQCLGDTERTTPPPDDAPEAPAAGAAETFSSEELDSAPAPATDVTSAEADTHEAPTPAITATTTPVTQWSGIQAQEHPKPRCHRRVSRRQREAIGYGREGTMRQGRLPLAWQGLKGATCRAVHRERHRRAPPTSIASAGNSAIQLRSGGHNTGSRVRSCSSSTTRVSRRSREKVHGMLNTSKPSNAIWACAYKPRWCLCGARLSVLHQSCGTVSNRSRHAAVALCSRMSEL